MNKVGARTAARAERWFLKLALVFAGLSGCGPGERSFEQPVVLGGETVPPDVLNFGELVYMQRCRGCHGQHGEGDGPYGSTMSPRPANLTQGLYPRLGAEPGELPSDEAFRTIITQGIDGTGMMASDLEGDSLHAVIQYIKTLAPVWRESPPQRVQ